MTEPAQCKNASSSNAFSSACHSQPQASPSLPSHRTQNHLHTPTEKLQASATRRADFIRLLSTKRVVQEEGLSSKIDFDLRRARDFQALAQLMYLCDGIPEPRVPSPQKLDEWLNRPEDLAPEFKAQVDGALQAFWHIANEKAFNMGFVQVTQRVSPVEFVFIGMWRWQCCDRDECANVL